MIQAIKNRIRAKELSELMLCKHLQEKLDGYRCNARGTAYCQLAASDAFFTEQYDCKDCEYETE